MSNDYIKAAFEEAQIAFENNEVPVGAVIVKNGRIISKAHNMNNSTKIITDHAEILAIKDACLKIGDWRLNDCEMYVTLEPCPMCAGAIIQSRMKKVYIGTHSNIVSNEKIIESIFNNNEYYHNVEFEYLNDDDCSNILSEFFLNKRWLFLSNKIVFIAFYS